MSKSDYERGFDDGFLLGTEKGRSGGSDVRDAERYRFIIEGALGKEDVDMLRFNVCFQPSGHNGNPFNYIEFGWEGPKWTAQNKADVDAAIDAAIAKGDSK